MGDLVDFEAERKRLEKELAQAQDKLDFINKKLSNPGLSLIHICINDKEKFNIKKAEKKVKEITDKYGFDINLESKVQEMSVSEKQTVEIVKVLYRGAQTLILDEPTAVLLSLIHIDYYKVKTPNNQNKNAISL